MVKRFMQEMCLRENAQKSLPSTASTEDARMAPRVMMDGAQPAAEDTPLNGFLGYQDPVRYSTCFISLHTFLRNPITLIS